MARKTKSTPASGKTILSFFTPASSSSKTLKRDTKSKSKSKRKSTPTPSQEVIIIDSDSDVEGVQIVPKASTKRPTPSQSQPKSKRRRLSSSSDDIEFVDSSAIKQNGKKKYRTGLELQDENSAIFGVPHLLMGQPSGSLKTVADEDSAVFGIPRLLLEPPATAPDSVSLTSDASLKDVYEDISKDEWATGDDEQVFPEGEGEEEETEQDTQTCPLCEEEHSFEEIEQHVNSCIDSSSNLTPKPKFPGALKPISQLAKPQLASLTNKPKSNAFSVLMSSSKESQAWKEASAAESSRIKGKGKGSRRKAPFYKVLQGMPIAVDAFRYGAIPGVTAYFLTRALRSLYKSFEFVEKWTDILFCHVPEGTANLVLHMLNVDKKWVHPLPMDVATVIPNTGGVSVTLIEANHCPGSSLFLFEGPQTINAGDSAFVSSFVGSTKTFRYLHCGDFRACPAHVLHPAVKGKFIDHVYLDTTYLDPKYMFPPQPLVIDACAELARMMVANEPLHLNAVNQWIQPSSSTAAAGKQKAVEENILFVVGTYSIGKERIVKAIAQILQSKIYCSPTKTALLKCQPDSVLHDLLTTDPLQANVHIVPLNMITPDGLSSYAHKYKSTFSRTVGFKPTGWTYSPPRGTESNPSITSVVLRAQQRSFTHTDLKPRGDTGGKCVIYGVPYSEHSSFGELSCFALSVDWARMIATVNVGSEKSRAQMNMWIQKWDVERKRLGKQIVQYRCEGYW